MEKGDRTYEKKDFLLQSAKAEFLKYGYEKASLRNICKNANVTTGALYFFFRNKADLFDSLVRDTALELQQYVGEKLDLELGDVYDHRTERGTNTKLIEYLYDNKDSITLLCDKSVGTKYEGYRQMVEKRVSAALNDHVSRKWGRTFDPVIYDLIARMRIDCYANLLSRELSLEQACEIDQSLFLWSYEGLKGMIEKNEDSLM